MRRSAYMLVPALAVALLAFGCGGIPIKDATPEELMDTLMKLVQAGQFKRAIELYEYDTMATNQNPDWYTFSTGQRNQIIRELQKDSALTLRDWAQMQSDLAGLTTEVIETKDDQASGSIKSGGQLKVRVKMRKVEDKWRVSNFIAI